MTIFWEDVSSAECRNCSGSRLARSVYSHAVIFLINFEGSGGHPGSAPIAIVGVFDREGCGWLKAGGPVGGANAVVGGLGQVVRVGLPDGLEKVGRCRADARDAGGWTPNDAVKCPVSAGVCEEQGSYFPSIRQC